MTLLHEKHAMSGDSVRGYMPLEAGQRSSTSGEHVLRWTLMAAVAITAVIAAASFVLSFATLWDLATMAGLPRNLSWLWPVIVDGTILQATISVIALAPYPGQRSGRNFFWAVLTVSALVSVSSNALHAFISSPGTLDPALAAAIATVAPFSLLSSTHGIALLSKLKARTSRLDHYSTDDIGKRTVDSELLPLDSQVAQTRRADTPASPTSWPNWHELAHRMVTEKLTSRDPEQVAEILHCGFELDMSTRQVAKRLRDHYPESPKLHHNTVGRVLDAARAAAMRPSLEHADTNLAVPQSLAVG